MNKTLWQYYADMATEISDNALDGISSLSQWQHERTSRREEFLRSMGLDAVPECDLKVTCYGEFSGPGYRGLRLAYQLLPDVWGTGNLLLPDPLPEGKLPGVLYACGHASSAVGDASGHTLVWPRRGYACFVFDTISQTDNTGFHRGLAAGTRLDWISRGYTAAGGELLNGLRAFEVLSGRAEVDAQRIGVTGRSGGGAQSMFLAIAQEQICAVVSIVGVPSLKWTIGERGYRGHCDCMYPLSLYQRDSADFAALIAPRPALYIFGNEDRLYSPQEYTTLVEKVRRIYRLYGVEEHCRLLEYSGGHGEVEISSPATQRWFDAHITGDNREVLPFTGNEVTEPIGSVFNGRRPEPDRLDLLPELLTVTSSHPLPRNAQEWPEMRDGIVARLRERVFNRLDRAPEPADFTHVCHNRYRGEIGGMETWLEVPTVNAETTRLVLGVCDASQSPTTLEQDIAAHFPGEATACFEPRATGLNAPAQNAAFTDLCRVGALLGVTVPLLWLNDIHHAIACLRRQPGCAGLPIFLYGQGDAAVACLYYAILQDDIAGVFMISPPDSHTAGGYLPGILREMDITTATGLMAPRPVGVVGANRLSDWYLLRWGHRVYHRLGMAERHALGWTVADVRAVVFGEADCTGRS